MKPLNRDMFTASGFDAFFLQYLETALWSTLDESDPTGGEPMDSNYTIDDIAPDSYARLQSEAHDFYTANLADIDDDPGQAGHDFWLTRSGHGAGFWDGDWPDDVGERLTQASKRAGTCELYVGDDGLIYVY
jgi:hypothetical protein